MARTSGETKKRTEIGIDDIRNIQQSVSLPPYEGIYRVYIIEAADLLSSEASNALLKTLEEPPPNVVIILLTNDETRVLQTVASRCQRIELKPISTEEIERELIKTQNLPADTSQLLARLSGGCLGWGITASFDTGYMQQRTQKLSELIGLLHATPGERLNYVSKIDNDRKNAEDFIKLWISLWRDLLLTKSNCQDEITHVDFREELEDRVQGLNLSEIKEFIDLLNQASTYISLNANVRLVFEVLMLEMPRKEVKAGYGVTNVSR
jgi:DNA polymerase-3 subunit delta'